MWGKTCCTWSQRKRFETLEEQCPSNSNNSMIEEIEESLWKIEILKSEKLKLYLLKYVAWMESSQMNDAYYFMQGWKTPLCRSINLNSGKNLWKSVRTPNILETSFKRNNTILLIKIWRKETPRIFTKRQFGLDVVSNRRLYIINKWSNWVFEKLKTILLSLPQLEIRRRLEMVAPRKEQQKVESSAIEWFGNEVWPEVYH